MNSFHESETIVEVPQLELPAILDRLPIAVWLLDPSENLVAWNAAAAKLFGATSDSVAGRSATLFVPTHGLPLFHEATMTSQESGEWSGTLTLRTATGCEFRAEVCGSRVMPEMLSASPIVFTISDSTERNANDAEREREVRWNTVRVLAGPMADALPHSHGVKRMLTEIASLGNPLQERPDLGGNGANVVVLSESPLFRHVVGAWLDAANFSPCLAANLDEATRIVSAMGPLIRAVVMAEETPNAESEGSLRALIPNWHGPIVGCDGTRNPMAFLESVVAAVSQSLLGTREDGGLFTEEPIKRQTVSL